MLGQSEKERYETARVSCGQPAEVQGGSLVYLNATAKLVCQLDASRRQLDRLEAHADKMLRSVGAA